METKNTNPSRRGSRPAKAVKRNQHLAVKCSSLERRLIERKAQGAQLTVSEYLRTLGLSGQVDMRVRALPREVVVLTGTLHHLTANLNQIAHRRNRGEELSAVERAGLVTTMGDIKNVLSEIKNYLQ